MPDGVDLPRARAREGPIEREGSFADVEAVLLGPETVGAKLERLAEFVGSVPDDAALEPYLLGVVGRLGVQIAPDGHDPLALAGLDPACLAALCQRLATMEASPPLRESLDGLLAALRPIQTRLLGWVGDAADDGAQAGAARGAGHADVCVPVVERDGASRARGALRSVRLRLEPTVGAESFVVGNTVHRDGAGGGAFRTARRAARAALAAAHPGLPGPAIAGQLRFGMDAAAHEGDSADLAVAALFYLALQALALPDSARRLVPGAVVTGRVQADGAVRPVDDATLALKVRAAFFSPAAVLVVPEGQRAAVERARSPLAQRYPRRGLPVVGVSHLRDLVGEALTERAPEPRARTRTSWRLAAVAVGAIGILGAVAFQAVASQPAAVRYEGSEMVVVGRFGTTVDAVPLAPGLAAWLAAGPTGGAGHAVLFDVDEDGAEEVVWWDLEGPRGPVVVKVKRPGAAELSWSTVVPEVRAGPRPAEPGAPTTRVVMGGSTGIEDGATVYLWASGAEGAPPAVVVLTAATGRRLSEWRPVE